MTWPVKFLIAGNDIDLKGQKGDVVEVVSSEADWGSATVTTTWLRLTIPDFPGSDQLDAEAKARRQLDKWTTAFVASYVPGAPAGEQRIRTDAEDDLATSLNQEMKLLARDALIAAWGGTIFDQGFNYFEHDTPAEDGWQIPLEEYLQPLDTIGINRFYYPESVVDQALGTVNPGEPAEFSRTFQQAKDLVIDRMKIVV